MVETISKIELGEAHCGDCSRKNNLFMDYQPDRCMRCSRFDSVYLRSNSRGYQLNNWMFMLPAQQMVSPTKPNWLTKLVKYFLTPTLLVYLIMHFLPFK